MQKILTYIIFFLLVYIFLRFTAYGWRYLRKPFILDKTANIQLANALRQHVYKLSHEIGDRSIFKFNQLEAAANYITEQFISYGYKVEFQKYNMGNKVVKNIIVTKVGSQFPDKIIIVGAHYDTCGNPGADDNASGISGILELAKLLANTQVNCTIKFIAFVNEEPPFFKTQNMGSLVYAKKAKSSGENIKAVLILEMIGYYSRKLNSQSYPLLFGPFYPNKGDYIGMVGNFSSRRLTRKIIALFKKQTQFPVEGVTAFTFIPGVDFSDHWSFWEMEYPAVMITDTGFYRNPNYHSVTDTHKTLDYYSMAEVIKGLAGILVKF
jgi:Zn-dependent M28 family amino/carboxypeptidase